jgi:hypothetical protein
MSTYQPGTDTGNGLWRAATGCTDTGVEAYSQRMWESLTLRARISDLKARAQIAQYKLAYDQLTAEEQDALLLEGAELLETIRLFEEYE